MGLARRFGTPLYVYSKNTLLARLRALQKAFSARPTLVCYAMKANSNGALCRLLAREEAGADVVSGGELRRALAAGFPPGRIVFSGVGKTKEELGLAVKLSILAVNIESRRELEQLEAAAKKTGKRTGISIRLNPDVDARTHAYISTGKAKNKFGVDRAQAVELARRAAASRWLEFRGIQCHIGSQITSLGPYEKAGKAVAGILARLRAVGIEPSLIDMGGGIGINYRGEKTMDLRALGRLAARIFAAWPKAKLLVEPGRYLTADAGVLLTTVVLDKESAGKNFVVVDAGMNDLARPALYGAYHPILPARKSGGKTISCDVVGPICESADVLGRARKLPRLRGGDVLAVLKCGAYGFSMSSQYNSRPRPAEILVDGGRAVVIRSRETMKDLVRGEKWALL